MPVFLEDPSQFSKERLKSELIAHNIALPPGESKKQEYLELYLKNVDAKNAADFSSDEEEDQPAQVDGEQRPEEPDMWDLTGLTDEDLKARLLQHGFQAGPITATTRLVYEKKLRRLMEPKTPAQLDGSADQALYSDREEEEQGEEEELPGPETVACVEKDAVGSKMETASVEDWYPQCFIPSNRRVKGQDKPTKPTPAPSAFSVTELVEEIEKKRYFTPKTQPALVHNWNGDEPASVHNWNSDWRPESCGRRVLDKFTMTGHSLLYSPPMSEFRHQMTCQVPVTDVLMEIFPEMEKTPTGISATRRRPIKGAAGRPVQFKYPDTPLSPNSADQREVQRRQVPLWVQLLIFALVSLLLYLAYAATEESLESPLTLLLDGVTQAAAALQEEVAAPSVDDAPVMADAAAPPLLGE
ncbi:LEM domain-containing protein 1 isoform X2 [Alosa sapidissima]|uniref:LEM domain-containing protein 1 isoform X2 n=1 Tax=Alosa sapidissima TaxID=34773 RepID=UPI001C09EA6F|nr:LEM domain-containing protein 1 isoform X2 [Alosa sapidissima]